MTPAIKKQQPQIEEEIILDSDIRDTIPCPPPAEVLATDSIFDEDDDAWI